MLKKIIPFLIFLVSIFGLSISFAEVDPKYNSNNGETILWELARQEGMSIGYNIDSVFGVSRTVAGSASTIAQDIGDSLATGNMLVFFSIISDQDMSMIISGTDVNATDNSDAVTIYLEASVPLLLDMVNINDIDLTNLSATEANVSWIVGSRKVRASAPSIP